MNLDAEKVKGQLPCRAVGNKLDAKALRLRSLALEETKGGTVVLQANEALLISQNGLQLKHNEATELISKVYSTGEYGLCL